MTNYKIVIIDNIEYVIIDHGNEEFTSMLKSIWDELEAAKDDSSTL